MRQRLAAEAALQRELAHDLALLEQLKPALPLLAGSQVGSFRSNGTSKSSGLS